jgi:hypothetical protein
VNLINPSRKYNWENMDPCMGIPEVEPIAVEE